MLVTPDHDNGSIAFRAMNAAGFGVINASCPAAMEKRDLLDELAKLIVSQPHKFG